MDLLYRVFTKECNWLSRENGCFLTALFVFCIRAEYTNSAPSVSWVKSENPLLIYRCFDVPTTSEQQAEKSGCRMACL